MRKVYQKKCNLYHPGKKITFSMYNCDNYFDKKLSGCQSEGAGTNLSRWRRGDYR